jgi:signal transduction histidine kinase
MRPAWQELYRQWTDERVAVQLRWSAALSLLGAALLAVQSVALRGPDSDLRIVFAVTYAVTSLGTLGLGWLLPRRAAIPFAVGYVIILIVTMSRHYATVPADTALAPAGFVAAAVGVIVILPWGARAQAVVGLACVVGYAGVMIAAPTPAVIGGVSVVLAVVPMSIAAARLIERSELSTFERTWQQGELLSLAREFAAHVDTRDVQKTVLEYACRLLQADSACLTVWDGVREVYRVEATRSADGAGAWLVGLEVPKDYAPAVEILARGEFVLPADDPENPLLQLMREHGSRHVLWVAMRYAGEAEGVLNFVRRGDRPFGASERRLARGIADQAAVALRTARHVADLRSANEYKSEFVSTMSHELRTPLNVMLGYADMLEDPGVETAERRDATARLKRAGRQLLELIENTLEIGRVDSARGEPRREAVALPRLWAEMAETCATLPRAPSVRLEWDERVPSVSLLTDPRKLNVVIRNLVGNALKFTDAGWVRADMRVEDNEVLVRIADSGIGIRPEQLGTIFEMFRQADQSDSRRHGGTGLGLYIVRRFAEQLGGRVSVQSEPGRGSTFIVHLPIDVGPDQRAAA